MSATSVRSSKHKTNSREPAPLTELALAIDESTFGPHHPNVFRTANNLGTILEAQGDLLGAGALTERARAIALATYGPDNPSTKIYADNLAAILEAESAS